MELVVPSLLDQLTWLKDWKSLQALVLLYSFLPFFLHHKPLQLKYQHFWIFFSFTMLLSTSFSIQISSMQCDHEQIQEWQFCSDSCILTQAGRPRRVSDSLHKDHTTTAPIVVSQESVLCPLNS